MQEELQKLVSEAQAEIAEAGDLKLLDNVRVKYLGKNQLGGFNLALTNQSPLPFFIY